MKICMANEKRLIDANALKSTLCNLEARGGHKYFRQGADCVLHEIMPQVIDDEPTVDAVEVVHAQWDNNGICTLCGYPIPTDSKYDFIYGDECLFCYHCGAKMNGGNEDV